MFSLFFVSGFYWPNHETVQMKYECFELFITFLVGAYFVFGQVRKINDWCPALFLTYCMVNLFTHGTGGNTKLAIMIVFFSITGIYLIENGISLDMVEKLKKGLVIYALLNCGSYFLERIGINAPFQVQDTGHLPTGFMVYPAHFALLSVVALFFAWGWKKILCLPLFAGLVASNEYSVWLGLGLCVLWFFRKEWWIWFVLVFFISSFLFVTPLRHCAMDHLHHKFSLRLQFWIPIFKLTWERALDGFGIGGYSSMANSIFPQYPANSWLELHNEPLQAFFEGGISLLAILGVWAWQLKKKIKNVYYEAPYLFSFILFFSVSCFHSPFHFPDCLWIFIVLYGMFQVEFYNADKKWDLSHD
jgi:hypothetical protein